MISFDFSFRQPLSVQEAVDAHRQLSQSGFRPTYYSGGTEIITLSRVNQFYTDAVIDTKAIPECALYETSGDTIVIGSAVPLTRLIDKPCIPLLKETVQGIADRTARNKITLGGNLNSELMYKEGILPLLIMDGEIVTDGPSGWRCRPIREVFHRKLQLEKGELLVQVRIPRSFAEMEYVHLKTRRSGTVGYPVVTVAALRAGREIRVAVSGLCAFPFRSEAMEQAMNQPGLSREERAAQAVSTLREPVIEDAEGSAEYRLFVLQYSLYEVMNRLEGAMG